MPKPKKKSEIKKAELQTKIEVMTLEKLLTHYVRLRFYLWDGSEKITYGPAYFVFESLPDLGDKEGNAKTSSKFHTLEEAKIYLEEIRNKVKEQLLVSIMDTFGEKDGDATEIGESISTVRLGGEDGTVSGDQPPF